MDFNRYSYPIKRPYANLKPKKTIHGDSWKKTIPMNQKFNSDTVMARLDTLLFRGSSGLALKYFLEIPLTDDEQENVEVRVAKEIMAGDPNVKNIVARLNVIIKTFKNKKDKPEDKQKLIVFKSRFRELYFMARKEYDEKVGE